MSLKLLFENISKNERVDIPTGWLQGRTIYGGLVAGMLVHKASVCINDASKKLLSCSVTFVGPVEEKAVRLTAEILRQGKSVTTLEVRLWQNNAVQSILVASFGSQRESSICIEQEPQISEFSTPEQINVISKDSPFPQCVQNFHLAWAEGNYPVTASTTPDFAGLCCFDTEVHPNREMQIADLVMLIDIWPPGVLPMFKQLAPASSLTWHLTFIHPLKSKLGDWFKYKVFTEYAGDGYATESAYLWDMNHNLLAISRQTVTVFA